MVMMMSQGMRWIFGRLIIDNMKRLLVLFFMIVGISVMVVKGGEPFKGYQGYVAGSLGIAYNPTATEMISTTNTQMYTEFSTTHGYRLNSFLVGAGFGYYRSFRDKENMYSVFTAGRYTLEDTELCPYIETRAGIVYDPFWVRAIQPFGALSFGIKVHKKIQAGLRLSMFSRPGRFFTANTAVELSYDLGK